MATMYNGNQEKDFEVYLIPCDDRAYYCAIAQEPPVDTAIYLVTEGNYPVELLWRRFDMNFDRVWGSRVCDDREALIEQLNFLGRCGHNVEVLWEYNDRYGPSDAITELFDICYVRSKEELMAALEDYDD